MNESAVSKTIYISNSERNKDLWKNPTRFVSSDEKYSPSEIVEWARVVMGSIDCDPCSVEIVNRRIVKAEKYYTLSNDGLLDENPWHGNIWMNPPWSRKCRLFIQKLFRELDRGNVSQYCVLMPMNFISRTSVQLCMWSKISLIHVYSLDRRDAISFSNPDGSLSQGYGLLTMGMFLGGPDLRQHKFNIPPVGNWARIEMSVT